MWSLHALLCVEIQWELWNGLEEARGFSGTKSKHTYLLLKDSDMQKFKVYKR